MHYRRVLLVVPRFATEWGAIRPHVGLGYLAETLRENQIEHDVFDMNLDGGVGGLVRRINHFRPDLLGITLISYNYRRYYRMLEELKQRFPGIKTVVGGPHVSIMRKETMARCPAIDYGVVLEGEDTLIELCTRETGQEKIRGLLFREGGRICYGGDRTPSREIDQIAFPRYEKFELSRYIREMTIISSRGCPSQCIFCPNRIVSCAFRMRSAANVVAEIGYWYSRGYRRFNFDDDNFNFSSRRVMEICEGIRRSGLKDLRIRCSNGIRADRVDRELLEKMKEAGFCYLAFGVDAGNDAMLRIIKKGETIKEIHQALDLATELGYETKVLFVVGTPGETEADIEDKVRIATGYPIQDAHFYNLIPYPGTELYEWINENGYFLSKPEDYLDEVSCLEAKPVFETPELPGEKRVKILQRLFKIRRKVHEKTVRRIFAKFGFLSIPLAFIVTLRPFEYLFYHNRFFRNLADRLRYREKQR